jgi:endonuclease VIII
MGDMPEGDTVWQAATRLHAALAGDTLSVCDLRVPAFATADLRGQKVLEVVPRGKHLLTRTDSGFTLHSHLGMEGSWKVYGAGRRWGGGPGHTIRAVLGTDRNTAVGYRLRVLELLRTRDEERVVGHLGPDLLGPDWDAGRALANLLADPGRPVGEALLDQRNLAGVGNIFKSETCFLARANPWLPVGDVPVPRHLVVAAKKLLEAHRERRGDDRLLRVYGRVGRPCPRCGTPVRKADQDMRPTYWCPGCQPAAPATSAQAG